MLPSVIPAQTGIHALTLIVGNPMDSRPRKNDGNAVQLNDLCLSVFICG
jgi:hypothetical protein